MEIGIDSFAAILPDPTTGNLLRRRPNACIRRRVPGSSCAHNGGLTSILAVPCCKTDNRSAVALEEEAIPVWLLSPVVVIGLFPHFSRLSTHRQVPVGRIGL